MRNRIPGKKTVLAHLEVGHRVESDTRGSQTWQVAKCASDDEVIDFQADDSESVFSCITCRVEGLRDDRGNI